ncbi:hypothetical protein ABVT39_005059 [Epinephelus coioides]
MVVKVIVAGLRGDKMEIDLCDTEEQFESITVLQLKEEILKRQPDCGDPEHIRLIFTDKILDEDSALLSAYGIQHMSVIHMVVREETRGAQQLATNSTDMGILLKVCGITGEERIINLCDTEEQFKSITVLQLKKKIIEQFGYQWQPSVCRLIYNNKALEELDLLSQYGIRHMSTIHVLRRLLWGGPHPEETRGAQQLATNSTDMGIQLKVSRVIIGEEKTINLCDTEEQLKGITVLQLKEKIIEEFGDQCQPSDLCLVYSGRQLEEPDLLSQYGISHTSQIYVTLRLPGGGSLLKQAKMRGAQQLTTNSTDMGIQLSVRGIMGEKKTIDLCESKKQFKSITVQQLKEKIIEEFGDQWQPSVCRLICCGRELEEPALLSQCRIRHMSTILVVQRVGLPGGGSLLVDMTEVQQFINSSTDMGIWINVRGIDGKLSIIDLCDTEEQLKSITVLQLKEKIIEQFGYQWQPSDLRLIYSGRELEEPALLSQYGISHMSTMHVLRRLRGGGVFTPPVTGDGGMGDKDGKNRSMEAISFF